MATILFNIFKCSIKEFLLHSLRNKILWRKVSKFQIVSCPVSRHDRRKNGSQRFAAIFVSFFLFFFFNTSKSILDTQRTKSERNFDVACYRYSVIFCDSFESISFLSTIPTGELNEKKKERKRKIVSRLTISRRFCSCFVYSFLSTKLRKAEWK